MLGQIASFMDTLHLTYEEVVNKIPYRNLLIMNKDIHRIAYDGVMKEVTEKEFFKNKIKFEK